MKQLRQLGFLDQTGDAPRALRLLGVRAEKLEDSAAGVQLALLETSLTQSVPEAGVHWLEAEETMDRIHAKFGSKGLLPARLLTPPKGE